MSAKERILTEAAPAPFQGAPYNQAIRAGHLLFVSGQLGIRAGETELCGESIEDQTTQALANLQTILEAAGSGLDKLVKTTVFLTDLADFAGMNSVYSQVAGDVPPARSTIQVAALPAGARVEIEAVALVG